MTYMPCHARASALDRQQSKLVERVRLYQDAPQLYITEALAPELMHATRCGQQLISLPHL